MRIRLKLSSFIIGIVLGLLLAVALSILMFFLILPLALPLYSSWVFYPVRVFTTMQHRLGKDINQQSKLDGTTPVMRAVNLSGSILAGIDRNLVLGIHKKGYDPLEEFNLELRDHNGRNVLYYAVAASDWVLVDGILEEYENRNMLIPTKELTSFLQVYFYNRNHFAIGRLLDFLSSYDIEAFDQKDLNQPLFRALYSKDLHNFDKMLNILTSKGLDINEIYNEQRGIRGDEYYTFRSTTLLSGLCSCLIDDEDLLRFDILIKYGADINLHDGCGLAPVMRLLLPKYGKFGEIDLQLLSKIIGQDGFDPNVVSRDSFEYESLAPPYKSLILSPGFSPLMFALLAHGLSPETGFDKAIDALLEIEELDLNLVSSNISALDIALAYGLDEIAQKLRQMGAKPFFTPRRLSPVKLEGQNLDVQD